LNTSFSQNLVIRALRQTDRAFWCLHDHLLSFALLGLPTLFTVTFLTAGIAFALRTWQFEVPVLILFWAIIAPTLVLTTLTFSPLPCAVYTWFQLKNEPKSVQECFTWCFSRTGRLLGLLLWMVFSYLWWFLLFWIPLLAFWPRTCQAPMVALFENQPQILRRSRQLVREDNAIYVLAGLFFLLMLVLGSLIPLPRLILFSKMFESEWSRFAEEFLWAFELVCGIVLICLVAVSWCVSLTFFYHNLRQFREGERIRAQIDDLYQEYLPAESAAGDHRA